MSDLSERYKEAADNLQISSDFKERTAEKMKAVRDGKADRGNSRRIVMLRTVSSVAAALVIVAGAFALRQSDDAVFSTESMAASETDANDSIIGTLEADVTEAVTEESSVMRAMPDNEENTEGSSSDEADNAAPEPSPAAYGIAPAALLPEETEDTVTETSVTEASVMNETEEPKAAVTSEDDAFADSGAVEVTTDALDDSAEEDVFCPEYEDIGFFRIGRGIDFSASESGSEFDDGQSYATVIPVFTEINEEETAEIYTSKTFTDSEKLSEILNKLAEYAEEGTEEISASSPSGSRYIIDLADDRGNALRVCAGTGFISFSQHSDEGIIYYTFRLDDNENADIEQYLYGLISSEDETIVSDDEMMF